MMAKAADPITFSPPPAPATTTAATTVAPRDNATVRYHPKIGVNPGEGLLPRTHSDRGLSRLAEGSTTPVVSNEPHNTTRTSNKKSNVTAFPHPSDEPFVGEGQRYDPGGARSEQGVGRHNPAFDEEKEAYGDERMLGKPAAVDEDLEPKGAPWHRGKANNFGVQDPKVQVPRTPNSGWVHIEEGRQRATDRTSRTIGNPLKLVFQVFGMIGLAETVLELAYVSVQKDNLRQFERFFFYFSASCELLGEVTAMFFICLVMYPAVKDGTVGTWAFAKVLLKDPIHNVASPFIAPGERVASMNNDAVPDTRVDGSSFSMIFLVALISLSSVYPNLTWGMFLPVWPGVFGDEDHLLRWWICGSLWVVCLLFYTASLAFPRGRTLFSAAGCLMWMYCFSKVVEIYLLFARGDRLASRTVGKVLRVLQVAEVSSVLFILWQLCANDRYRELFGEELLTPIRFTGYDDEDDTVACSESRNMSENHGNVGIAMI